MRYARLGRDKITYVARLNFLLNQATVTVKVSSVVVLFGHSISNQACCYFETIPSGSFDIYGKVRSARGMFRREGPRLKTDWRDGITIEFYDAAFLKKPVISLPKMHS